MKKEVGLWIDHREAILVFLNAGGEEIKHITSNSINDLRSSDNGQTELPQIKPEDQRDRKFDNSLKLFYDEIIASLRDTDSIQIMGPGGAKIDLEKRLESEGLKGKIVEIETVDRITEHQIAAKVRGHFHRK